VDLSRSDIHAYVVEDGHVTEGLTDLLQGQARNAQV